MAANAVGIKTRTGSVKRPAGQELERPTPVVAAAPSGGVGPSSVAAASAAASASAATQQAAVYEPGITPVPLKYVVQEAVKRWFEDTLVEAQRGDVKQQALLGQMYAEGYGVNKDAKAAKEWSDKASSRGYRMQGVYCSAP